MESAFVHRSSGRHASPRPAPGGPLDDWPVSVKDNFCTFDMPTSCSSRMLRDYRSPFEATAVKLLREAGACIIAKSNCDEFGMGSANLYSVYGPVLNPESWVGEERVAGGSSGGAAASTACHATRIALASDTGGSIRTPAAYCGVYGLKPSYGLVSRWGLVAYADSLDTVGLLGASSNDIRTAFRVISRFDEQDPTSIPNDVRDGAAKLAGGAIEEFAGSDGPLSGLRVGVPVDFFPPS
ncbi:hypothetical protein L7F22_057751 [Adiantum nelumboides]|nr:hypothetical protein [Adiantum nelumboides]